MSNSNIIYSNIKMFFRIFRREKYIMQKFQDYIILKSYMQNNKIIRLLQLYYTQTRQ